MQAQDYVLFYEGPAWPGRHDYSGYVKLWWRIRLSKTSAAPSQEITLYIEFKWDIHYEGPSLLPITEEEANQEIPIRVNTGGLTSEPLTVSLSNGQIYGIVGGELIPFDFQGSSSYPLDFVVPEDATEGSYQFQATAEHYNPSNTVYLEVISGGSFFKRHPILTTGGIIVGGVVAFFAVAGGVAVGVTAVSSGTLGITITEVLLNLPLVGSRVFAPYLIPIMLAILKPSSTPGFGLTEKAKALWKLFEDVKDWLAHLKFQGAMRPLPPRYEPGRGPGYTSPSNALSYPDFQRYKYGVEK